MEWVIEWGNCIYGQPAHHQSKASPLPKEQQGILPLPSPFPSRYP